MKNLAEFRISVVAWGTWGVFLTAYLGVDWCLRSTDNIRAGGIPEPLGLDGLWISFWMFAGTILFTVEKHSNQWLGLFLALCQMALVFALTALVSIAYVIGNGIDSF